LDREDYRRQEKQLYIMRLQDDVEKFRSLAKKLYEALHEIDDEWGYLPNEGIKFRIREALKAVPKEWKK
jgi:hypothetical protein